MRNPLFSRQRVRAPHVATLFVNAPARIAAIALDALDKARAGKNEKHELSALRLFAAAVLFAMQMSRPVRTGNLIRSRVSAAGGALLSAGLA